MPLKAAPGGLHQQTNRTCMKTPAGEAGKEALIAFYIYWLMPTSEKERINTPAKCLFREHPISYFSVTRFLRIHTCRISL